MSENTGTTVQQSAEHPKSFAPLDPATFPGQLLWLAITFGLLYVLVRRVVLGDTQVALARYTQAVADARSRAGEVAKGLREKVKLEVETERARIEAEIAARISEAEKRIAAAQARALASVGEIANEVARAIVSKLIDEEVTTDEVKSALVRHAAE
jgi:F-type H+-transporting ATPase subunit b